MVRLSNDKPPCENNKVLVASELYNHVETPVEVDMNDAENFYMLAMVDVALPNAKQIYDKKVKALKDGRDKPNPMSFLPGGISDTYVTLMRGLQFLDPVDPDTLITLSRQIKQEELWVRSALNTHTPLEAAISAGFTEFGSETADEIAKILVARGAPLIRPTSFSSKKGGPTSSPLHMMMARGQFARLEAILKSAKEAGRIDGDAEPHIVDLLFEGNYNQPEDGSPIWACVHSGMAIKFLQSSLCRDTLQELAPDSATTTARAGLATYALRAAALGIIARDPEDFARLFEQQSDFNPQGSVAGLPLNRAVEGGAKNALPVSHVRKLISLIDPALVKSYDASGRTVLISAICAGNVPVVDALLELFPELAFMPARPLHFDAKTFHDDEQSDINTSARNRRAQLFERLRQTAVKNGSSNKWGAESADPRTFGSPLADVRPKFPLEFASELHDVSTVEAALFPVAAALTNARASNSAERNEIAPEILLDSVDCALANLVGKKCNNSNLLQNILSLWSDMKQRSVANNNNNNNKVPTRSIASAVSRGNKDFLRIAKSALGLQSFDLVLDQPYVYFAPAQELISAWKSSNSPVVKSKSRGLRALISQAHEAAIEEGDKSFFVKKLGGVRLVTPLLLTILNNFDLDMARFLVQECNTSTSGDFMARLYQNGDIKFFADDNEDEEHRPVDVARHCDSWYVATSLRFARDAPADRDQRQLVLDFINFLINNNQSKPIANSSLGTRLFLLNLFLGTGLPTHSPSTTSSFLNQLGLAARTVVPASSLSSHIIPHLAYIGFTEWEILPQCLLIKYLTASTDSGEYGDETEPEGEENRDSAQEEQEEGGDSVVSSRDHPLIAKLFHNFDDGRSGRAIGEVHNFTSNAGSRVRSAFGDDSSFDQVTLNGRVSFCNFVVDAFWNANSAPVVRRAIFFHCLETQALVLRRYKDEKRLCPPEFLTFDVLMNFAESKDFVDVPLKQSWASSFWHRLPFRSADSDSFVRFLKLFGSYAFRGDPTANANLLRTFKDVRRFVHDPLVVQALEEYAAANEGNGHAGSIGELRTELFMYARIAGCGATSSRNYSHILENPNMIDAIVEQASGSHPIVLIASTSLSLFEKYFVMINPSSNVFDQYVVATSFASLHDNDFFKIAAMVTSFWFDNWCVDKLREFFGGSAFSESKASADMWYRFENFLAVIANACRTIRADQDQGILNPIFHFLIQTGLVLLESDQDRVRLYNVIARSVFSAVLPNTVRALADARSEVLGKQISDVSELIDKDFFAYEREIMEGLNGNNNNSKQDNNNEDENDEDDQYSSLNDPPFFSCWELGAPSLVLRFGGVQMLERLSIISKDNCYGRCMPSSTFNRTVENFVNQWDQLLAAGHPLDMRLVNVLFKRASFYVQVKLIRFLVNRGTYINEEVFEGKSVATFMFEALTSSRIENTKAIVEILDLGTRYASDPGAFVRAYSEAVDMAIREECAAGNMKAIEVAKRCAESIRETDDFKERGPFQIFDNIFKYDRSITDDPKATGIFQPLYANLGFAEEQGEDGEQEDDESRPKETDEQRLQRVLPKTSEAHDRLFYLTFKHNSNDSSSSSSEQQHQEPESMNPSQVEEFLRYTLDGTVGNPSSHNPYAQPYSSSSSSIKKARYRITTAEEAKKLLSIAPSVCMNSTIQRPAVAAKITIPRIVSAIRNDVDEDELATKCGSMSIDAEKIKRMKSGEVRLEIDTSGRSSGGWAYLEFDSNQFSCFVLRVNPNALAQEIVPENVVLSEELEKILNYWNQPKLFDASL